MSGVLAHRVAGAGEPLLLLNGGMMSMAAWQAIATPLEATHRVIRCDLRGQLLSPGDPPPGFAGHADEVIRLLDALEEPSVHLAGTSYGGFVALLLAARHPRRVRSLTVITAAPRITTAMWEAGLPLRNACRAAAAGGDRGVVPDLVFSTAFSAAYLETQRETLTARSAQIAALPRSWFLGLVGLLDALHGLDLRADLTRISAPVLVVGAEMDRTFAPEHSVALAAGIAGARLEIVPHSGHALVAECPERVAVLLSDFLGGLGARTAPGPF